MKYRVMPGTDIKVSALGMGCMRLPTLPGENDPIDKPEAIKMIRHAIDNGVNYIDTAYGYHNGMSESLVGEALADGYREKVLLATKLPVWLVEKYEDMERLLDEQLARLNTEYVDVYLLHAIGGERFDKVEALGATKFLDEMVAKGKIRYPGFSFHDEADAFLHILNAYDWKVCQVQMNLLDEFKQATMAGVYEAARRGIGVIVMEPVRGGSLVQNVPAEILDIYASTGKNLRPADWAFKWLLDKPEFFTILSGMSNMEQIDDNLRIFDENEAGCLSEDERKMLTNVRLAYEARIQVGCTGCEYCLPCPQEINIPRILRGYDDAHVFGRLDGYFARYKEDVKENLCIECGACVSACPQHFKLPIPEYLAQIHAMSGNY
ncbi:MAG: aldo/keto reductase [Christensenellales bacterium]|jgi:predicted aldo/keto reductase-like oxidoreductase